MSTVTDSVDIQKIPGGMSVDGLALKNGKCGCTSILRCCHSYSKLKRDGNNFTFVVKTPSPDCEDLYSWGYIVEKAGHRITVTVEDARDKTIFSGYYPPRLEEWTARGWTVIEKTGEREDGELWRCAACKWLYNVDKEGKRFEDLPDDWKCPTCRAGKGAFEKVG